jgi:hypothetical protein
MASKPGGERGDRVAIEAEFSARLASSKRPEESKPAAVKTRHVLDIQFALECVGTSIQHLIDEISSD